MCEIPRSTRYQDVRDTRKYEIPGPAKHQEVRDTRTCEIPRSRRYQDVRDTRKCRQMAQDASQDGRRRAPREPQDGPKIAHKTAFSIGVYRAFCKLLRHAAWEQDAPTWAKQLIFLRFLQRFSQPGKAPRWPRMVPRWPQDGPKTGPRGPQDGPR